MTPSPAFEPVQPRADGLNRRPAVKAVGRVGRKQEAAVSGQGAPQEAPDGRAGLQSVLLAGEVPQALLDPRIAFSRQGQRRSGRLVEDVRAIVHRGSLPERVSRRHVHLWVGVALSLARGLRLVDVFPRR